MERDRMRKGLSYDDVLVIPARSSVESRSNVSLVTNLTDSIQLDTPICSAPMDTVTDDNMAIAVAEAGGLGFIHRFLPIEEQAKMVSAVRGEGHQVVGAVGVSEDQYNTDPLDRANMLVEADASALCVDVAHGHHDSTIDVVERLSEAHPEVDIIAGNVATYDGGLDLSDAGADVIKVGIGPGSLCTTREVAGAGVPQFTAVSKCSKLVDVGVIADGGIKKSGDIVKAIAAGADAVMIGGLFASCVESPAPEYSGEKSIHGMASADAKQSSGGAVEGVSKSVTVSGSVSDLIEELNQGLASGASYAGASNMRELQEEAEFIQITPTTKERNGAH